MITSHSIGATSLILIMDTKYIATASVVISAPGSIVWNALVDPALIRKYMFGTIVVSDWIEGSSIVWKGEWKGKPYEDKGTVLRIEHERLLEYTHYSPLSGAADVPENYHTVTIELLEMDGHTTVTLSQDNNKSAEERDHSAQNWAVMLDGLKKCIEGPALEAN